MAAKQGSKQYWPVRYIAVLVLLVLQIVFYYLFTRYYS